MVDRVIPLLFRLDADQREALRSARGANLRLERASAIAWLVLPVVLLAALVWILVTG